MAYHLQFSHVDVNAACLLKMLSRSKFHIFKSNDRNELNIWAVLSKFPDNCSLVAGGAICELKKKHSKKNFKKSYKTPGKLILFYIVFNESVSTYEAMSALIIRQSEPL